MKKDDCFLLGYVSKLFGFKGEVIVFLDTDEPNNYIEMESVFVNLGNKLIPFFIEKFQKHSKQGHFIVQFKDINSIEQAEMLVGKELYLPLTVLPELCGKQFYFHEVIGYSISDKHHGIIGKVKDIIDAGSTPIFQIFSKDKEILLPIHDNFIISIDRKSKTVHYDAPDGLIDMYLDDNLYLDDE